MWFGTAKSYNGHHNGEKIKVNIVARKFITNPQKSMETMF